MRKLKNAVEGDYTVMNNLPDTIIYTVGEIEDGFAHLRYYSGTRLVSGGHMPLCTLGKPTKVQLENGNGLQS